MAILKKKESDKSVVKKETILVRVERVKQKEAEGFKIVDKDNISGKDRRGKVLGIRSHSDDLVLMEK